MNSNSNNKNTVLEFKNVSKSFDGGKKEVFKDISFSVKKGQSFVLIGQSGVGKSVAIKLAIGLLKPDKGSIKLLGKEISSAKEKEILSLNRKISFLFQGGALFDSLNVIENVAFPLTQVFKMPKKQAFKIALEKLEDVGLPATVAQKSPSDLSGGMKKRVALARAIINEPEIIFFDEPTTGLDPITSDMINDLIIKCVKKLGATAITITHDMHSAQKIADYITMLDDKKIVWQGTSKELTKTKNTVVKQFLKNTVVE